MLRRFLFSCVITLMCSVAQVQEQQTDPEVAVLRAQLETMESYNERLLATVYWSLGGVFTIVILVAGFGWFTNSRLYERDKETLRQELKNVLGSEAEKIFKQLTQRVDENVEHKVQAELTILRHKISLIRVIQLKEEIRSWRERDVPINALRTCLQFLEEAIKADNSYWISDALDGIRDLLDTKIGGIETRLVTEFNKMMGRLPEEYNSEAEELRKRLRAARD